MRRQSKPKTEDHFFSSQNQTATSFISTANESMPFDQHKAVAFNYSQN